MQTLFMQIAKTYLAIGYSLEKGKCCEISAAKKKLQVTMTGKATHPFSWTELQCRLKKLAVSRLVLPNWSVAAIKKGHQKFGRYSGSRYLCTRQFHRKRLNDCLKAKRGYQQRYPFFFKTNQRYGNNSKEAIATAFVGHFMGRGVTHLFRQIELMALPQVERH